MLTSEIEEIGNTFLLRHALDCLLNIRVECTLTELIYGSYNLKQVMLNAVFYTNHALEIVNIVCIDYVKQ